MSMVAERTPQGCCRAKVPQVIGTGRNVLPMCVESGVPALRQGRREMLVLLLERIVRMDRRTLSLSVMQVGGVG